MSASMLALAPTLIAPVLAIVERLFGAKEGENKLDAALSVLIPLLQKATSAGKIGETPDEDTLKELIEHVLRERKELSPESADIDESKSIRIPPGATVTIKFPKEM